MDSFVVGGNCNGSSHWYQENIAANGCVCAVPVSRRTCQRRRHKPGKSRPDASFPRDSAHKRS